LIKNTDTNHLFKRSKNFKFYYLIYQYFLHFGRANLTTSAALQPVRGIQATLLFQREYHNALNEGWGGSAANEKWICEFAKGYV